MNYSRIPFTLAVAAICALSAPTFAQERGTAAEAKALAEKGIAHIKAIGFEKASADFTAKGGAWQSKDLYIFVQNFDGSLAAHGVNPAMVGKNLIDIKDANGKAFGREIIDVAKTKGTGWVDYMWTDPVTKKPAAKSTYVARIPNMDAAIGVGIYK